MWLRQYWKGQTEIFIGNVPYCVNGLGGWYIDCIGWTTIGTDFAEVIMGKVTVHNCYFPSNQLFCKFEVYLNLLEDNPWCTYYSGRSKRGSGTIAAPPQKGKQSIFSKLDNFLNFFFILLQKKILVLCSQALPLLLRRNSGSATVIVIVMIMRVSSKTIIV